MKINSAFAISAAIMAVAHLGGSASAQLGNIGAVSKHLRTLRLPTPVLSAVPYASSAGNTNSSPDSKFVDAMVAEFQTNKERNMKHKLLKGTSKKKNKRSGSSRSKLMVDYGDLNLSYHMKSSKKSNTSHTSSSSSDDHNKKKHHRGSSSSNRRMMRAETEDEANYLTEAIRFLDHKSYLSSSSKSKSSNNSSKKGSKKIKGKGKQGHKKGKRPSDRLLKGAAIVMVDELERLLKHKEYLSYSVSSSKSKTSISSNSIKKPRKNLKSEKSKGARGKTKGKKAKKEKKKDNGNELRGRRLANGMADAGLDGGNSFLDHRDGILSLSYPSKSKKGKKTKRSSKVSKSKAPKSKKNSSKQEASVTTINPMSG
jgi:hypothetical protein